MDDKKTFEGFRKPTKHFYHMPNEWTDIMADINNLAELKVIEYLIRHTWGFKEYDQFKFITIDEFMHGRLRFDGTRMDKGTGLKSDRSVKDGLKAAIEDGYVICEQGPKAKVRKAYKLKMQKVDTTQEVGSIYPEKTQDLPTDKVDTTYDSPSEEKETEKREKEREKEDVHSSSHSSSPSSSSQDETVTAFLRMYTWKFYLEMEVTGKLMDEHLKYLQKIYHASEVDKETFRFEVEKSIEKTRKMEEDTDYFYDCLCSALHLEQAN